MEIDGDKIRDYALFHINRRITNLYKSFLFILEDLRDAKYSVEDPRIYQATRKRILDLSNDALREIEQEFNKLEINLKFNYNKDNYEETP